MSEDTSLEKYTSHFIEGVVCEMEFETEQRLQHIDPWTLLAITAFLSRSPGLLNLGPGGPALCWELVPTARSGMLTSSSERQLIWNSCRRGYIIVLRPLNSTCQQSRPSPDLLISSTRCTCYLHRCISYFDSLARSVFNIQQFHIILIPFHIVSKSNVGNSSRVWPEVSLFNSFYTEV